LIHRLTYRRTNHENIHVRAAQEFHRGARTFERKDAMKEPIDHATYQRMLTELKS
jgi:phosphoketolase